MNLWLNLLFFQYVFSCKNNINNINININNIRNYSLRFLVHKNSKLIKYMKKKYKIYHDKTISIVGESIIEYEKLPYEDKAIIDFIASLVF
jgi:hypothetical protein